MHEKKEKTTSLPKILSHLEAIPPAFDYDKIDLPEGTRVDIYLADHFNAYDLGDPGELRSVLTATDIFMPEAVNWTDNALKLFEKISAGNRNLYDKINQFSGVDPGGFELAFHRELLGTKVKISMIDLPAGHYLAPQNDIVNSYSGPDSRIAFDRQLQTQRLYRHKFADVTRNREQYLLEQITSEVNRLTSRHNRLAVKQKAGELTVAVLIGGLHVSLASALDHKRNLLSTTDTAISAQYGFSGGFFTAPNTQAYALALRGLPVDDVLIAQDILLSQLMGCVPLPADKPISQTASVIFDTYLAGRTFEDLRAVSADLDKDLYRRELARNVGALATYGSGIV